MKIALLSAFYPYRGGIAQFGAMLYRALEKRNITKAYTFTRQYPNVLFPGTSQFITEEDNADQIPALRVLDSLNPSSYKKTAKVIAAEKPDVIISQYWMPFFGPAIGGVHKRLSPIKRVSILHNVIPHEKRFFDAWANKQFIKHNDGFVVLSDAVLKDLLSLKPDAKYLRIDHPVYSQFGEKMNREKALMKLKLDPDRKYLLFFGFIRDYKGLDLLLGSMKELEDDIHLIVAGEVYGSFDKYKKLIKELELEDRVHLFTNYISDDEVTIYFSASDACVLPYKSATQSGIIAIANHFDLPVIATDVGGLKENIAENRTGIIVPEVTESALSNCIKRYFQYNLKATYSGNIQTSKQENSWDNFAERLVDFVQNL